MKSFVEQGAMTSPGKCAPALDALPSDVASLLAVVRGLFVHRDFPDFYGLAESDVASQARETLPLEDRLDQILQLSDRPLTVPRPLEHRVAATCRDYAVMLCGLLRHKSLAARVRCGFASYFLPGRWEDHWICEYLDARGDRWVRADAQLDGVHCDHLAISFNPSDLPDRTFITSVEAWDLIRKEEVAPECFGHGDAAGEWFLLVNLARDCLALQGREVSPWDGWRSALGRVPEIDAARRATGDHVASAIRNLEQQRKMTTSMPGLQPFWSLEE